jgi:hypothetical protein
LIRSKKLSGGWAAVFALIIIVSVQSNAFAKNNLLDKQGLNATTADKAVFLVSKTNKDKILEKYENATSLSDDQLIELLKAVGFTGKALKTAYAVAKAESNGRPYAFNGNVKTLDQSYGVFQINMIDLLGEKRRDKFDLDHNADLFNPVTNAEIAYFMTNGGTDWSAWSSYNSGAIGKWLNKFPG